MASQTNSIQEFAGKGKTHLAADDSHTSPWADATEAPREHDPETAADLLPKDSKAQRRVLIVEDHPIFRHGIASLIDAEPDLSICGQAESAPLALDAMRRLQPDLALVDISLPGPDGIELVKLMKAERPDLAILLLSMHDESLYALRGLKAGARGYIMKAEPPQLVIKAIRSVLSGGIHVSPRFSERLVFKAIQSLESGFGSPVDKLSDRELEVLQLIGKGQGTRDIAQKLTLSIKTVETHRAHIKEKLGCKDSAEMVRFAIDWVGQELE